MNAIVRVAHDTRGSPPEPVAGERVLTGTPMQSVSNAYSDAGNAFHCGVWEGGIGSWRVSYSEHELCHLLAGQVRLRGDDGSDTVWTAGDSFVVPAGFQGIWEVLQPARKLYAIYEPPT